LCMSEVECAHKKKEKRRKKELKASSDVECDVDTRPPTSVPKVSASGAEKECEGPS
jgi:hypothetical protein